MSAEFSISVPKSVSSIVNCTDKDCNRLALDGVFVKAEGDRATMAATGGRCLVTMQWPLKEGDYTCDPAERGPAVVSTQAIKSAAGGRLTVNGRVQSVANIKGATNAVETKEVEGRFPAYYNSVIPTPEALGAECVHLRLSVHVLEKLLKAVKPVATNDGINRVIDFLIPHDNPDEECVSTAVRFSAISDEGIETVGAIMPVTIK